MIVEDADFPLELEKVVTRSFIETDAKTCSLQSSLSSGTTALTAMIFGRSGLPFIWLQLINRTLLLSNQLMNEVC